MTHSERGKDAVPAWYGYLNFVSAADNEKEAGAAVSDYNLSHSICSEGKDQSILGGQGLQELTLRFWGCNRT